MDNDGKFLRKAIDLAVAGIRKGGGPFAAIITLNDNIVAAAGNRVVLTGDPTAHAEILAIREAALKLKTHNLSRCVLYTTCEPCPMCLGAIYWAGIKKVVYASDRHDAAEAGFSDNSIYKEVILEPSNREIEFLQLNEPDAKKVFAIWEEYENRILY
ncbi:MAG: nucleoside deaminase [Bacteroidota bacterium]|nr:nucleoside deaminase [Bacteroidota bacterium]